TFDRAGYDDVVLLRDIPVRSVCEHHMAPIRGVAHVAYLPGERVVGISKLARLVDAYARRLQIQERLTAEIADTLQRVLQPRGVGMRGVAMVTRRLLGAVEQEPARREILALLTAGRAD